MRLFEVKGQHPFSSRNNELSHPLKLPTHFFILVQNAERPGCVKTKDIFQGTVQNICIQYIIKLPLVNVTMEGSRLSEMKISTMPSSLAFIYMMIVLLID